MPTYYGGGTAGQSAPPQIYNWAQAAADASRRQNEESQKSFDEAARKDAEAAAAARATTFSASFQSPGPNGDPYTTNYGGPGLGVNNPTGNGGAASGATAARAAAAAPNPNILTPDALSTAISQLQKSLQPHVAAPPHVAQPQTPQQNGPSLAYSQAKDASGRTGAAAVRALHDLMSRRGFSDSGLETAGEASILSDVARQQSGAEYANAAQEDARHWEGNKLGYQGDMGQNEMGYQGDITQRGQDMNTILNLLSRLQY